MAGFLGLNSEDWTALGTITLAIVGVISFVVSGWVIREMRKDRKLGFVRTQLDELYYPFLAQVQGIETLRAKVLLVAEITSLFREKGYLAAPKLRKALVEYFSKEDEFKAALKKVDSEMQTYEKDIEKTDELKSRRGELYVSHYAHLEVKGPALVKAAEEEKAELSESLMKLAGSNS